MTDWQTQAACVGVSDEVFFPPKGASQTAYKVADGYCSRCPVRAQCETEAFLADRMWGAHGFWAGMPPEGRARLVRR